MECGCLVSNIQDDFLSHHASQKPLSKHLKKQKYNLDGQKQTLYKSNSHAVRAFEFLDSLRKDEVLCDIKLETDDGTIVYAHKVILASASPYFHTFFTSFEDGEKDHVILRELHSTTLKFLVDFIYTAQIMITEENVQVLLHAANLLQLYDVRDVCCDFLLNQLNPTNCLGIKALVSLKGCEEYLPSFKFYIQQNFTMVVQSKEFLDLQYEELVKLISCNDLNDPSEEKVFECVINWVNHNSSYRKDVLPKLMEHVRLPLVSEEYLLNKVYEEPFMKNSFECKDYLIEALRFHLFKSKDKSDTTLNTIHTKPRQPVGSSKIILVVGQMAVGKTTIIKWYDPLTYRRQLGPEINMSEFKYVPSFAVINNQFLFFLNGLDDKNVFMLDLLSPSPCLKKSVDMIHKRKNLGVGVLGSCIYAVGGSDELGSFKSAEVFDFSSQKWQKLSRMSIARNSCGVGILNDHLYAVGGFNNTSRKYLKSVECYCPSTGKWTRVANMNVRRCDVGIGVLNGVMYAIGGYNETAFLNSVEAYNPNSNTWTIVSNMNCRRSCPGIVVLDGLLYVFFGDNVEDDNDDVKVDNDDVEVDDDDDDDVEDEDDDVEDDDDDVEDDKDDANTYYTVEMYNPKTNVWSMVSSSEPKDFKFFGAVVIDKPLNFKT